MPTEYIIFDCDGTLVDSEPLENKLFATMLCEQGIDISTDEATQRFRGMKTADCIAEAEKQANKKLPDNFTSMLRKRSAEIFKNELKPIPGVHDLISSLNLPMAVASSGSKEKIELSLTITGLLPFFDDRIFSSYDLGSWKPEPDIFLHSLNQMGGEPHQCCVVEDSIPGILAGLAAGMKVFAYQDGIIDPRIPRDATIFTHMNQLQDLLSNS